MQLPNFLSKFTGLTPASSLVVADTGPPKVDAQSLKQAVVDRGVRAYYDELSGQKGRIAGTSISYLCWHHDEKAPSLTLSAEHGGYECKACGASGDLIGAWMHLRSVDFKEALSQMTEWIGGSLKLPPPVFTRTKQVIKQKVEQHYETVEQKFIDRVPEHTASLLRNDGVMAKLRDHYGIDKDAVEMYKLGWDVYRARVMIPVYVGGRLVNVRMHDAMRKNCCWLDKEGDAHKDHFGGRIPNWDVKTCRTVGKRGSKVVGIGGHNSCCLYPSEDLSSFSTTAVSEVGASNPWLALVGGELKAILLNSKGIPAVCFTSGEGAFSKVWLERFRGLNIDICMDADDAGRRAAGRLAKALFGIAAQIRTILLPFGDPNDYYRSKDWDVSDWWDLPREGHVKSEYETTPTRIKFGRVHDVNMAEKPVILHAIVAGGTDRAKFVISGCKVVCDKGEKKPTHNCKSCSLPSNGFARDVKVPATEIVSLSKKAPSMQEKRIREDLLGVPSRCGHPEYEYIRSRVMPVLLCPDSESEGVHIEDTRHFIFPTYYLGADIPSDNEAVEVVGRLCADPKDSSATMIADRIRPAEKSIRNAKLSDATKAWLRGISDEPPETHAGTVARLQKIMIDVEYGITRIYDQRVMLNAYLLLYFMPVRFKMFGQRNGKVSAEILVVGDSRQGKTTAMEKLRDHFGAGAIIDAEGASYAGLVGGQNEYGSAGRVFSWGALPLNDGGIVTLDEIDELVENGVFGKLTSIRSSGVASRTIAGGTRRTSARLRLAMLSNPKGSRELRQYDSLMYAMRELISKPADLARFEFLVGVYAIKNPKFNYATEKIQYTKDIAQEHLRWAWKQEPDLSTEVSQYCADLAAELCKKYRNLPTLAPTESRWKIARLACSFAAIAFSVDDKDRVLVTKEHADVACEFLEMIYSTPEWKISSAIGTGNIDTETVTKAIESLGGKKFAKMISQRGKISASEMKTAWSVAPTQIGMQKFDDVIAALTLFNDCLTERRGRYIKTEQFRRWLEEHYPIEDEEVA